MTFVISTDDVDRHGDVISVKGWRLESYRRNPVFLWAHDYTQPAIGRAVDVWTEEHGLLASIDFASTEFAREVAALYRGGYQTGVSVGFKPLLYEMRRDTSTGEVVGINFMEQELLEISAAPVPANRNALRKALDGAPRMRSYYRYHGFSDQGDEGGGLLINRGSGPEMGESREDIQRIEEGKSLVSWDRAFEEILDALRSVRI